MELPLVLLALMVLATPSLVDARVDVVPALLVHEEHLPPISSEPTYTLGRFVTEMLKFQGDEIYSNGIRKPSLFKGSNNQNFFTASNSVGLHRSKPFTARNTNKQWKESWSTYTEVIFHPVQTEKLIDILQAPPTLQYADTNNVERISFTTSAPPAVTMRPTVTNALLLNNGLRANDITVRPARALSSPFATKATLSRSSTTVEAPLTVAPTIDIIDAIRKELRARQKPSPRPFLAPGKIFKKRNSQWELIDSSNNAKNISTPTVTT